MIVDLQKDELELRELLIREVKSYAAAFAKDNSLPKVSAVEVGYQYDQDGWVFVHFDKRPKHNRDGEWTRSLAPRPRGLMKRPLWHKGAVAKGEVTFLLPDGKKWVRPDECSDTEYAKVLGEFIKGVLQRAKTDGLFESLPKHDKCQVDIEEFEGNWAWPKYEQLGKTNLL